MEPLSQLKFHPKLEDNPTRELWNDVGTRTVSWGDTSTFFGSEFVSIAQFGTFTNFTWVMKLIDGLVGRLEHPDAVPVYIPMASMAASLLFEEYVSSLKWPCSNHKMGIEK